MKHTHVVFLSLFSCLFFNCFSLERDIEDCNTFSDDNDELDIVWATNTPSADPSVIFDKVLSPTVFNDFIIFGFEDEIIFLDKFTGDSVKAVTVTPFDNFEFSDNYYWIEGNHLIYERREGQISVEPAESILETINLTTGERTIIDTLGKDSNEIEDQMWKENVFEGKIVVVKSKEKGAAADTEIRLYDLETKTYTLLDISSVAAQNAIIPRFCKIWRNTGGDILVTYLDRDLDILRTRNLTSGELVFTKGSLFNFNDVKSMHLDGKDLFLRTADTLFLFDLENNEELWATGDLPGPIQAISQIHTVDNFVLNYLSGISPNLLGGNSRERVLMCFERSTGEQLWRRDEDITSRDETPPFILASPRTSLRDGFLYYNHLHLAKIDLSTGCKSWHLDNPSNNFGFQDGNSGFSASLDIDNGLGFLFTFKENQVVAIRL